MRADFRKLGGIVQWWGKTAGTAQGGRTSMAFQEANIFAKRILDALQQNEIYITANQRAFRYYDDSDEIII